METNFDDYYKNNYKDSINNEYVNKRDIKNTNKLDSDKSSIYKKILNRGIIDNEYNYNIDYNTRNREFRNSSTIANNRKNSFLKSNNNNNTVNNNSKLTYQDYQRLRKVIDDTVNQSSENSNVNKSHISSFSELNTLLKQNGSFIVDAIKIKPQREVDNKKYDTLADIYSNRINKYENSNKSNTLVRVLPKQIEVKPTKNDKELHSKIDSLHDYLISFNIEIIKYFQKLSDSSDSKRLKEVYSLIEDIKLDILNIKMSKNEDMFERLLYQITELTQHVNNKLNEETNKTQVLFNLLSGEFLNLKYNVENKLSKYETALKNQYKGLIKQMMLSNNEDLVEYVKTNMIDFYKDEEFAKLKDNYNKKKKKKDKENENVNNNDEGVNKDKVDDNDNVSEISFNSSDNNQLTNPYKKLPLKDNQIELIRDLKDSYSLKINSLIEEQEFITKLIDKDRGIFNNSSINQVNKTIIGLNCSSINQIKNFKKLYQVRNRTQAYKTLIQTAEAYVRALSRIDTHNNSNNNISSNNTNNKVISKPFTIKTQLKSYFLTQIVIKRFQNKLITKSDFLTEKSFEYFNQEFSELNYKQTEVNKILFNLVKYRIPQISKFTKRYIATPHDVKNILNIEGLPNTENLNSVIVKIFDELNQYFEGLYLPYNRNDGINRENNISSGEDINSIDTLRVDYNINGDGNKRKDDLFSLIYKSYEGEEPISRLRESKIMSMCKLIISDEACIPYKFFSLFELMRVMKINSIRDILDNNKNITINDINSVGNSEDNQNKHSFYKHNLLSLNSVTKKFILVNFIVIKNLIVPNIRSLIAEKTSEDNKTYLKLVWSVLYYIIKDYYIELFNTIEKNNSDNNDNNNNIKNNDFNYELKLKKKINEKIKDIDSVVNNQLITKTHFLGDMENSFNSNPDYNNINSNNNINNNNKYSILESFTRKSMYHLLRNNEDILLSKNNAIINNNINSIKDYNDPISNSNSNNIIDVVSLKHNYNLRFYETRKKEVLEKIIMLSREKQDNEKTKMINSDSFYDKFYSKDDVEKSFINGLGELENELFSKDSCEEYFNSFNMLGYDRKLVEKLKQLENNLLSFINE